MLRGVRRPCLGCGVLTQYGSRCEACQAQTDLARSRRRGPRHYGGGYTQAARKVRRESTSCFYCHEAYTPDNPCEADHVRAGDPLSPLVGACRRCNRSKSNRTIEQFETDKRAG